MLAIPTSIPGDCAAKGNSPPREDSIKNQSAKEAFFMAETNIFHGEDKGLPWPWQMFLMAMRNAQNLTKTPDKPP